MGGLKIELCPFDNLSILKGKIYCESLYLGYYFYFFLTGLGVSTFYG